jgi:hypothetical protein
MQYLPAIPAVLVLALFVVLVWDLIRTPLRQWWCSHEFDTRKIHRLNPELVSARCMRCEKVCLATHGLALPGKLV